METNGAATDILVRLTAGVVTAYVGNNQLERAQIPELIASVMDGLRQAGGPKAEPVAEEKLVPAVPIKKSVTDDFIVCLEDGKEFKSLKRHLLSKYAMTPEEYRAKWKLPADYPMVAPNYAAARSRLALEMGLGRKAKAAADSADEEPAEATEPAQPAPKRRASRKAAEAA
jgi:predicted transcriptional regulator